MMPNDPNDPTPHGLFDPSVLKSGIEWYRYRAEKEPTGGDLAWCLGHPGLMTHLEFVDLMFEDKKLRGEFGSPSR